MNHFDKVLPLPGCRAGHVLVVDDEEPNRRLLRDILEAEMHQVTLAGDGSQALDMAFMHVPDVVLLDVMMPKMDGYEVCRQLRADSRTAHLPVLLVTVLNDRIDRIKGIQAGANDFLSKPIDAEEIRLHVRNAVYAKQLYDKVQCNYARLQELGTLRDNLTHMIVHDLRSPLAGLTGCLQILAAESRGKLSENEEGLLQNALSSGLVLLEMVNSLLDVNRMEEGRMVLRMAQSDIDVLIQEARESLGSLTMKVKLVHQKQSIPLVLSCDANLIIRVIANLVGNAVKFTPTGGTITVSVEQHGDGVKLVVADTGRGIPLEYHAKIFDKFGQVECMQQKKMYSTGLGLTFCKLAVEAHGGRIGVDSEPGRGSSFWFTIPGQVPGSLWGVPDSAQN